MPLGFGSGALHPGPAGVAGRADTSPAGLDVHRPQGFRCEHRGRCARGQAAAEDGVHSLRGYTQHLCVCHFVLIPLLATSSNQVSPGAAQTLFGRWELLTWLSPKNPEADWVGARPTAVAALVPALFPGTLLS